MKRLFAIGAVALPLVVMTATPARADVKTHDHATIKFEGMLGRMFNLFGGKGAREGVETTTAVKGNRKATVNGNTGKIIDLSEQKVYDLDMKKKTYTVTTFEQLREKMKEDEEKAQQEAAKEQPSEKPQPEQQPQQPQKQMQVDFDVKDTGQKKQIAGYDTHEAIITITVHEKGKALEDSGGIVLTDDVWLGPDIPQMKELSDFDLRYWQAIDGPQIAMDPQQMATVMAMYPQVKDAMNRLQKGGTQGTPLDSTMTFEAVKSKEQMAQDQQNNDQNSGGTGGIGGMLARRMMKNRQQPQQRSTIFTTHEEVLEVTPSVTDGDVAIPPDFKEKK